MVSLQHPVPLPPHSTHTHTTSTSSQPLPPPAPQSTSSTLWQKDLLRTRLKGGCHWARAVSREAGWEGELFSKQNDPMLQQSEMGRAWGTEHGENSCRQSTSHCSMLELRHTQCWEEEQPYKVLGRSDQ